jgi:hypothetical protein
MSPRSAMGFRDSARMARDMTSSAAAAAAAAARKHAPARVGLGDGVDESFGSKGNLRLVYFGKEFTVLFILFTADTGKPGVTYK